MPASRVKNLILIILALCNICLLILVVPSRLSEQRLNRRTAQQLQTYYETNGIRLPEDPLPESRALYTLEAQLDAEAARLAAQALLGDASFTTEDTGSYQVLYRSNVGTCSIRRSALNAELESRTVTGTLRAATKKLLRQMGISVTKLTETHSEDGRTQFTANQTVFGSTVFSAELTFSYDGNALLSAEGSFCPIASTLHAIGEQTSISCADALIAFLRARDTTGWVGSAILSAEQGYLIADTASASTLRLQPVWKLETDTGSFLVDAITREVAVYDAY